MTPFVPLREMSSWRESSLREPGYGFVFRKLGGSGGIPGPWDSFSQSLDYWVFITGGCSGRVVQWMGVVLYHKLVSDIIPITKPCFHCTTLGRIWSYGTSICSPSLWSGSSSICRGRSCPRNSWRRIYIYIYIYICTYTYTYTYTHIYI